MEQQVGQVQGAIDKILEQHQSGELQIVGPQGEDVNVIIGSFPLEELEQTIGMIRSSMTFECTGSVTILKVSLANVIDRAFMAVKKITPGVNHKIFYRFRGVTIVLTPLMDYSIVEQIPEVSVSILDERVVAPEADLDHFKINEVSFGGDLAHGVWINQSYFVPHKDAEAIKVCVEIKNTTSMRKKSSLYQGAVAASVERTYHPSLLHRENALAMPIPKLKDKAGMMDTKALKVAGTSLADAIKQRQSPAKTTSHLQRSKSGAGAVIPRISGRPAQIECPPAAPEKCDDGVLPIYGQYHAQCGIQILNDVCWGDEVDMDMVEVHEVYKQPESHIDYDWQRTMTGAMLIKYGQESTLCEQQLLSWQYDVKNQIPVTNSRSRIKEKYNIKSLFPSDNVITVFPHDEGRDKAIDTFFLKKSLSLINGDWDPLGSLFTPSVPRCVSYSAEAQMLRGVRSIVSNVSELSESTKQMLDSFRSMADQWATTGSNVDAILELASRSFEQTAQTLSPFASLLDSISGIFMNTKEFIENNTLLSFLNMGSDAWPEVLKALTASLAIVAAVVYTSGGDYKSSMWQISTFLGIVWSPLIGKLGFNMASFILSKGSDVFSSLLSAISACFSPPQKVHTGGVSCVAQVNLQGVDLVGAAVRCIVMLLGGIAFYAFNTQDKVSWKKEQNLFKRLSEFGRDIGGISIGIKTISEWSASVSDFLRDWIFDLLGSEDPTVNELRAVLELDPLAWANEITDLHLIENRDINLGETHYIRRVRQLYDIGIKLQDFIIKNPVSIALTRRIGDAFKLVVELRNEISASNGVGKRRIDPYHICLYGEPSAGKTFLMDSLLNTVLDYFDEPLVDRKYSRSVVDKYWSRYHGQTAVTMDDLGAVLHNDTPSDLTELLNLKSNEPHMVNMASVEEKGRFFTSRYLFSTTNMRQLDSGAGLRTPDAFYRRRDAFVHVERRKDANGEYLPRVMDFSHLDFTFLRTFPPFQPIDGVESKLSYTEFLKILLCEMGHYYDDQERALQRDLNPTHLPSRCAEDLSVGQKPIYYPLVAQAKEDEIFEDAQDNECKNSEEDGGMLLLAENDKQEPWENVATRPFKRTLKCKEDVKLYSTKWFLRQTKYNPGGDFIGEFRTSEGADMFMNRLSPQDKMLVVAQGAYTNSNWSAMLDVVPDISVRCILRKALKDGLLSISYKDDGFPIIVAKQGNEDLSEVLEELDVLDVYLLEAAFHLFQIEINRIDRVKAIKSSFAKLQVSLMERWTSIPPGVRVGIKVLIASTMIVGACSFIQYFWRSPVVPPSIARISQDVPLVGPFASLIVPSSKEKVVEESAGLADDRNLPRKPLKKKILDVLNTSTAIAETTSDEQALTLCHSTYAESLGIFFVERADGSTIYEHCCFIGGTLVMLPAHLFFKISEGDAITILDLKAATNLRYEPTNLQIFKSDRDVAVYDCGPRFQARKHLTQHFISEAEAVQMRAVPGVMLGLTVVNERLSLVMKMVEQIQPNEINDEKAAYLVDGDTPYVLVNCWKYKFHTMAGECGSLLVRFNPRVGPKLLGFHVASHRTNHTGYAEIITSEMLSTLLGKQNPLRPQFNGIGIDLSTKQLGGIETSRMKILPRNDVRFVGALPLAEGVRVPDETSIKPSILHDAIGPHKTEPCILSPADKRCPKDFSPMRIGLEKFGEPTLPFVKSDIEAVADSIYMDIKYLDNSLKSRAPLTDKEAINGRDGVPFYDRINMNSSEGYPYCKRRPSNRTTSGKRWMFKEAPESTEDKVVYEIDDPELLEKYRLREELGRRGERVESFSTDCIKDERVALEKIYVKPKSRLFTILPVDYNLLIRKYFLDFCVMTMEHRNKLPGSVGINPFSDEWSSLYHRLRSFSPVGFAGDYKLFDGQADPEIIFAIVNIINKWYGGSDEDSLMRHTLANEISHRYTLGFNAIFEICRGIPSGIPLTVIINCFINMFYLRLAWRNLAPLEVKGMSHFRANVKDVVYGDDNIVAIKEEVLGFYNLSTVSAFLLKHGITLTDHHKVAGADALPFIKVRDFQFLKREFSPHPNNHLLIRCPLVKTSIEEQIHWIRRGGDDEELLLDNINRALIESVQHGEEYFNDLQGRVARACLELNLPPPVQSFAELDEEWRFMASGLDPLLKGYALSGPKLERLRAKYTAFGVT